MIGPVRVKNRVEVAPAAPFLAGHDASFSIEYREYVKNLAKSGAGIVNTGVTACNPHTPEMQVGGRMLEASFFYASDLDEFAEICHMYGAKASLELVHTRYMMAPQNVTASLPVEDIGRIIEDFSNAARVGASCGFDIICIHGGHGNVPSVFFSQKHNQRKDQYGGSFENRCRFGVELLDAVRAAAGPRTAISYRISAEEMLPGWTTLEETIAYAKFIQDKVDLLSVSRGLLESEDLLPYLNAPPYFPRAINLPYAREIKKAVKTPVTVVNAFNLELGDEAVSRGDVDMVSMVRTIYADTDCVNLARQGKLDEARPCVRCNTCINRTHSRFISVRCAVNPLLGRETVFPRISRIDNPKHIAIIGGGPGGLEAARTASKLGCRATLFEKENELGGNLRYAAAADFKDDMRKYLDWSIRMTEKAPGVTIRKGTTATPELVAALNPDAVIVALGAKPILPRFSATGTPKLQWVGDVELGRAETGESVLIVGAGFTGLEAGLALALKKKKVRIIDMIAPEQVGADGVRISMIGLRQELAKAGVEIECNLRLVDVTAEGAEAESVIDGTRRVLEADTVLLSLGLRADAAETESFEGAAPDVVYIGDCVNSGGTLYNAVHGGFDAVMNLCFG
jgi:2,4-dienoyl-CoA reductase-like NADH-dependent reductase (Old Yellow Enzyme family)/NADPH-dependent 2,4-dienoyl-CoA reductase/sulfur reductase-like enzyme